MSSELWTVLIGILIGAVGRALYANFGGLDIHLGPADEANNSWWASFLRDLDAQEGTVGAVIIGVWEGVLLHQVLRLSARAAAGVFAGLAGRLILDLVSAPPGQAARFTASLLGISLGMLLSEVVRGVFDEKDHWEDRTVTHYHKSSRRLRKHSAAHRRRTTSGELEDPDLTDDPRSVAASTAFSSSRRHRRSLSDSQSGAGSNIRGASPLPSVLTGDLEAEIADLRMQASAAAGQQRKYQEEQRYEYAQGNGARALQLAWEVKRYEALAESLTRQVGDKIVEAHRRAVEKELATPVPTIRAAPPTTTSHRTGAHRPGGYYSENDARNASPIRVTVSTGGETYEVTANDEEVEIGPNLRVRTRHVYQPSSAPQPPQPSSVPNRSGATAVPSSRSIPTPRPAPTTPTRPLPPAPSPSATPSPGHGRPPRSAPRSKLSNFAQSVGGTDEDMRSVSVGSRAKTRSRRGTSD
ncbi:hypothetical protein BDV93DRAFT_518734 [Ceratobasidium sp. AG-I]|nr:hypothetical protein BDV93DRAFT_518734 [Ceratobasidium sp. AG-I]